MFRSRHFKFPTAEQQVLNNILFVDFCIFFINAVKNHFAQNFKAHFNKLLSILKSELLDWFLVSIVLIVNQHLQITLFYILSFYLLYFLQY